ncbi:uncharacterized protein LOC126770163 [Nymphalis io]|uniref:uncharacterized protein LOC126770163 n=1 Tax=Inachis io TaxID=171585 RepID=UPI0021690B4B|nr:uncharacterized protein LOC126770163 [Nymphalis io]
MALSDSMFLFEIGIKHLKCYTAEKELKVVTQFAEIFKTTIKNPITSSLPKNAQKVKVQSKQKVRKNNAMIKKTSNLKPQMGRQSILIVNKLPLLVSYMKHYPLELSFWRDTNPNVKLGSVFIPWNKVYVEYLSDVEKKPTIRPPCSQGSYSIYDDLSSKRVVLIELSIKLTYLGNKITSHLGSISKNVPMLIYTQINSKTNTILNTGNNIKSDNHNQNKLNSKHITYMNPEVIENIVSMTNTEKKYDKNISIKSLHDTVYPINTVKSNNIIIEEKHKDIDNTMSCLSIRGKRNDTLKYIFGDSSGTFGNQVYCVGYFSVQNDSSRQNSPKESDEENVEGSRAQKKFKFKKCASDCPRKERIGSSSTSANSLNLSDEAAKFSVIKCKDVNCNDRIHRKLPPSAADDRINLDISTFRKPCCNENKTVEKIEEVIGGVTAKMKYGEDPCFCACECTFGFTKKTTYCGVCGGYELAGEELTSRPIHEMPIPCPIFHKILDKSKLKPGSTSGSESRKKLDDQKNLRVSSPQKAAASDKPLMVSDKKSVESEKDSKKGKKKNKKDDRFKFNYGYKGIPPQIGHSKCGLPCSGTLDNVPKNMGWLWTAENVPGMKFRPMWKPGATSKHVVRLLKIAKNPGQLLSKKKRKDINKRKRPIKRPLLIVHKKDGEYTITMETMKSYLKPRTLNQQPYEDKPVVTYFIGRTDEENRIRLKKKERARRRLERAQRDFIQSTFRDMCEEICLKTYQQALGILPDTEDPKCMCYPALPTPKTTNMNVSCSCSEDELSIGSDTDSDEWIVEFTPPNAIFDPSYKGKKIIKVDNGSQYSYLDYRVKLVDRFGNLVPRFFKGLDGKEQCSDLGGFWSPEHNWLEINVDGYIAPDGRWAPNNFIGPSGEQVDAETGKFQAMNGKWLVVGVDGYIDCHGKWKFYPAAAGSIKKKKHRGDQTKKWKTGDKKYDKSETSWSCFGDVSPRQLSKLGIVGHGGDRKLLISTLQDMLAHGEDINIPQPKTVFHLPFSKKSKLGPKDINKSNVINLRAKNKCHHPVPSDKGIVAVDAYGNKTYFKLRHRKNLRPRERLATLEDRGISLSSFHVPCFHSFINSEVMKKQLRDRLLAQTTKTTATQVHKDWKPGAVSKRLLKVLNKAKIRKSTVEAIKRTRRVKKKIEEKPTLIVSKNNGKYHIEMQVTSENSKYNTERYMPLIYEIESTNNKDKIKQRERLQRRLVKAAVKNVWSDPYHPEACENICAKTYNRVIGDLPLGVNCNDEEIETINSSCEDEEVNISTTSSDVNWEIHFTPPLMCYQALHKEDENQLIV